MTLRYKDGIDINGNDVVKSKKYSNIKVAADNQRIFDTAVKNIFQTSGGDVITKHSAQVTERNVTTLEVR